MGLEVGWYLRLGKTDRVEALLTPSGLEQVRHTMDMYPDWSLTSEDRGDHVLAIATRNTPVFSRNNDE